MSKARGIRFSDAVNCLSSLTRRQRGEFYEMIRRLALSDGLCVPKEVLLLIALKYCLLDRESYPAHLRPYLISCPMSEASLSDPYMIYLESSFDEDRNREIRDTFRPLVDATSFRGFNFIYIPRMVEEFKAMSQEYVKDVIGYMAPSLSREEIGKTYQRLCELTTAEFLKKVLSERLKVRFDVGSFPALLINIGSSYVPYCSADGSVTYYTEFLCLPLGERKMIDLVYEILDFYQQNVSIRTVTVTENPGQFKYFGFYKSLFDFLITPEPALPRLIFAPKGTYKTGLYRDGRPLCNGRNLVIFRLGEDQKTDKILELTPKLFQLYQDIGRATYTPPYKGLHTSKVNAQDLSHLRKKIAQIQAENAFPDLYRPEKDANFYKLRLDRKDVAQLDVLTGQVTAL